MAEDAETVAALRRDLQGGEDLAPAMRLVADALDRRIERLRWSLDEVARTDPHVADGLATRLSARIAQHHSSIERHRERLEDAVDDLQLVMDDVAADLEG